MCDLIAIALFIFLVFYFFSCDGIGEIKGLLKGEEVPEVPLEEFAYDLSKRNYSIFSPNPSFALSFQMSREKSELEQMRGKQLSP